MWTRIRKGHRLLETGRVSTLACIFILAAGMAQAQAGSEQTKGTLELKLSAPVRTLCEGASIDLEMEAKNVSRVAVRLDRFELWRQFSYSKSYTADGSGRGGGVAFECSHCRGDVIVIYPGETFWTSHKFSLHDEFFHGADKYDIGVLIDSVALNKIATSNKVEFELINCGKTESEVKR